MNQRPANKQSPWWLRGQALVEFSLILPTLLFLILGIMDYGRILLIYSNASSAIRDATRNATLLGEDPDTNLPFYVSCATIIDQANDILFATIDDLNILYYESDVTDLAALETRLEAASTSPEDADFDCEGTDAAMIGTDDLETGDIMVVTLDVQIEFITPILANIFPSLDLNFRSQRTIVTRLAMVSTGPDRDGDGLLDTWEMYWFGCLLDEYHEEPANASDKPLLAIRNTQRQRDPMDDDYLVYVAGQNDYVSSSWAFGTLPITLGQMDDPATDPPADEGVPSTWNTSYQFGAPSPSQPAVAGGDCATEEIDPDDWDTSQDIYPTWPNRYTPGTADDYSAQTNHLLPLGCTIEVIDGNTMWTNCWIPNTFEYNSTDDPDGDGCNNGCEEVRDLNPLEVDAGAVDTDGDGLTDGQETSGFLQTNTRLVYDNSCVATSIASQSFFGLDPNDADTDNDDIGDGTEVLGTLMWNGSPIYTDPEDPDTDGDGILDGHELNTSLNSGYITNPSSLNTDCDGISDKDEIVGFDLPNLEINQRSTPRTGIKTNPTLVDSDNDGFDDGDELNGVVGTGTIYCTSACYLDPSTVDTDGDGLGDGDELEIVANGGWDTDPTDTDTDNDTLEDGDEVYTFGTNPSNTNTDADSCTAANGATGRTLGDKSESTGIDVDPADLDPDSDGDTNGDDLDSDGDDVLSWGLTPPLEDCEETYYYGTNPYLQDTDGDGMDDGEELQYFCRDPKTAADAAVAVPCAGDTGDSEPDGLPDTWEISYFTNITSQDGSGDPDNDGCDNRCEYSRRTNPNNPDTDGDNLNDGNEATYGTNPINPDTDGDGLQDGAEVNGITFNTTINGVPFTGYPGNLAKPDPRDPDTDGDGLPDGDEISAGTRFDEADTDGDGLTDEDEVLGVAFSTIINGTAINLTNLTSNPLNEDGDGDGLRDYNEIYIYGTFPFANALVADPADSDGDTIQDGTTAGEQGEEDSDFNSSLIGWGTNVRNADTDTDGLSDGVELVGINPYNMTVDGAPVTVNLAGYSSSASPKLNVFNPDTDADGFTDGDEVNTHHTDPLNPDTDADFIQDGVDPNPLVPDAAADTDGDGIPDSDETAAIPPTYPNDFDSDGDGMGDGDESFTNINITATGYNLSTDSTYTINHTNESFDLETTYQDADGDGTLDGFDSDGDGLSDTYEMYWYRSTSFIQGIHPQFTGFRGAAQMEGCGYALTGSQPLHPDDPDTDNDGLLDGDECNTYNTNPFSAAAEGPIFDKVTNSTFLNSVVYPALEGDLELAAASARALNYALGSDGLITLNIVRAVDPPNKRQLIPTTTITTCGASAYTNSSGVTTTFPCVAGVFVGGQPSKNNNDLTSPVVVRVPLSRLYAILSDSTILSATPVTN